MPYQETHSWINFQARLTEFSYADWLLLGEAQSKSEHVAHEPLLPQTRDKLHQIYLAKGVLATTAIEGNTLTEEQVRLRIENLLDLPPSKEYLGTEIDNIVRACNRILEQVKTNTLAPISATTIIEYNRQVLRGLAVDDLTIPGEVRKHTVRVGTYLLPPAEECEILLEKLADWLNQEWGSSHNRMAMGILKAIIAHLYIAWIHPFGDGNGRTARLVELQLLMECGVPSAAAQLLSNHYNQTRSEYYRQLDRASKSGGDIISFIRYALQGFVDGLKEQLLFIQQQQVEVHWQNYIYAQFHEKESKIDKRRRNLMLDLSAADEAAVPLARLRHISPRSAEAYAGKSDKTVQRDVAELAALDLVAVERGIVRTLKERMLERRPLTIRAQGISK